MRISQINAVYGFGSTGLIVKDLQETCRQNGIDCEVVYSVAKGDIHESYHIGNLITNKLHALLSRISGKQGYFSIISTMKLLSHYEKFKPNIIHLHNLHGCYINLPILLKYAAKKDIAIVVTLHDCWFYTGGCCHYTSNKCYKWKSECGQCPARKSVKALLYDGTMQILKDRYRLFGGIKNLTAVGVSQWIADEAKQSVFKNANCVAIYNGINTDFFHPVGENEFQRFESLRSIIELKAKKTSTFFILCPANKWFLDINRNIFDYFASRLTDDMRMVFIGSGVDERRLTDKMINIGFVSSREEIRAIYSACDVMVNCTREDSLSLLNVEVQACGTPVITYSNTGAKETVDGKCGYAVENGNPVAAWRAMECILQDYTQTSALNCRNWVVNEFNSKINYMKYIQLYHQLV